MAIKGTRIDEKHLHLLHEGRQRRVYRFDNTQDGIQVLVKFAKTASPFSRQAEMFANELRITQQFEHPGIRKALETGTLSGKAVLYLEYIDGLNLQDFCAIEKPGLSDILTIGMGIAEILTVLHGANIIYKNLSSEHVMIGPGQRPVLIDFSIAVQSTLSQVSDPVDQFENNLAYISPEQTGRINRGVDYRTDLYSLGVVLYEMLTGLVPFTADTNAELIYEHIARQPQAVSSVNPEVPGVLSDIVMKLLNKGAEERYQSAFGVVRDLERCLAQYHKTGHINSFTLGRDDVFARLLVPQRLYGRNVELAVLEKSFQRAACGKGEIVLVSGPEGSGKTLLVNELQRGVIESGGVFISGTCDQYQRNVPCHGINQAFFVLSSILSAYSSQRLHALRLRICRQNQDHLDLLSAMCPGLHMLVTDAVAKESEDVPKLPPNQPLHAVICSIFSLLSCECGPLVLFLDNLQWADAVTLDVIRLLAGEKNNSPFLLIGAYDDSSSDAPVRHNLKCIDQLSDNSFVQHISLKNLDQKSVQNLIEDMIHRSDKETADFAEAVFTKTKGNPLLVITFMQSLHTEGALWFDCEQRSWQWDDALIHQRAVVEDVIASVTMKIQELSEQAQDVIMTAACIGNEFSLETLGDILGSNTDTLRRLLLEIEENLLVVSLGKSHKEAGREADNAPFLGPTRFTFTHARVRMAAESMLPQQKKRRNHLELGRLFLSKLSGNELKNHIFAVVDQLNEGFRYLKTEEEFSQLAELNCMAGHRARCSGGYAAAVWYLNMGLGLLPKDRWNRYHDLSCTLYEEAIEAEYLNCNFPRVHVLAEELSAHITGKKECTRICKYQILAHVAQGDRDKALTQAFKALEVLGVLSQDEIPSLTGHTLSGTGQVDVATIIKASRTLSQEIQLERLLEKFMQIVMENAGAEKAVLVITQGDKMFVQAQGTIDGHGVETFGSIPLEESDDIPQSLISAVVRQKHAVVLGDAQNDPEYAQDVYFREHLSRSVLGLPLIHQKKLAGVLYLENNLAADVFALDQLQLLDALLSQAAISIENAKLYQSLEEKLQELRLTQDALMESRNWLDRLLNALPEPIFVKDRNHRWELLNDAFCAFVGLSREELLGKSDYDFFPKEEADVFWSKDELVFNTGRENVNEEKITNMHGEKCTILTKKILHRDEKGNPHLVGILRDITERVNLEAQLRQAVKMEAVGNLAGGLAHDFNNLLTAIMGYCDLLQMRVGDDERLQKNIRRIKKAGQSAASLTQQLLVFSRKQVLQPRVLDLNHVVVESEKMLRRLIGENIHVECQLQDDLDSVIVDPVLMEQIIMNLCINARDAMPDGGKLTLETANVELDAEYASHHLDVEPGHFVVLTVSDTGVGFDEETKSRIFEPFFTTKDKGKGTGLGLATVYGIVTQSQGHIVVYSELGVGTTFKVYLPRAEGEKVLPEDTESPKEEIVKGKETILLVEDETMVRELACTILQEYGYRVLAAINGREALQILDNCSNVPDLLITDVVMPEMGGRELAEQMALKWPDIRILFISGYTGEAIHRHGVLDKGIEFLQKPFTPEAFAKKVRDMLDTPIAKMHD
ncbi:AAA family ATPase [Desulfogranum japonicum]|uniref:AAA family ATPase n=1 Tax=Desulfogranum japonicum TaxID=231447 RepID=UPI000424DAA6|nr:AAA family ATPase [Desulfogranum japonicum]